MKTIYLVMYWSYEDIELYVAFGVRADAEIYLQELQQRETLNFRVKSYLIEEVTYYAGE